MASIFASVAAQAEEKRRQEAEKLEKEEKSKDAAHRRHESAAGPGHSGEESGSEWMRLMARMRASEKLPGDEVATLQVASLIQTVFREHLLTENPGYAKYFPETNPKYRPPPGSSQPPSVLSNKVAPEPSAAPAPPRSTSTRTPSSTGADVRGADPAHAPPHSLWARYRASPLRRHVYLTLSCPDYSRTALVFGSFILAVILLNTATFVVESVPHYEGTEMYDRLVIVDYVCLGIFTLEFLVRLATCNSFLRFSTGVMNWIDLAAILPFYIELIVQGPGGDGASQTRIIRLLRLLRVLRLLRATSKFRNLQLVLDSLASSTDVLAMLLMLLVVLLVVSATIVYFVEQALVPGTWFDSIPSTMYYMHTTLTTTGYGDLYPGSAWGKFIAGVFMLLCMVTLSLPISVIGGNFSTMWGKYVGIRDGLDRSGGAWATFGALREVGGRQCAALDDLIDGITRAKCVLEDGNATKWDASASGRSRRDGGAAPAVKRAGDAGWGGGGDEGVDAGGIKSMAEELVRLRGLLQAAAQGKQDPSHIEPLRARLQVLRGRLAEARDRAAELQTLLAVCPRVSTKDFTSKLDRLDRLGKDLEGAAADGAWVGYEAQQLLGDLAALREVAGAPPEMPAVDKGAAADDEEEATGAAAGGGQERKG